MAFNRGLLSLLLAALVLSGAVLGQDRASPPGGAFSLSQAWNGATDKIEWTVTVVQDAGDHTACDPISIDVNPWNGVSHGPFHPQTGMSNRQTMVEYDAHTGTTAKDIDDWTGDSDFLLGNGVRGWTVSETSAAGSGSARTITATKAINLVDIRDVLNMDVVTENMLVAGSSNDRDNLFQFSRERYEFSVDATTDRLEVNQLSGVALALERQKVVTPWVRMNVTTRYEHVPATTNGAVGFVLFSDLSGTSGYAVIHNQELSKLEYFELGTPETRTDIATSIDLGTSDVEWHLRVEKPLVNTDDADVVLSVNGVTYEFTLPNAVAGGALTPDADETVTTNNFIGLYSYREDNTDGAAHYITYGDYFSQAEYGGSPVTTSTSVHNADDGVDLECVNYQVCASIYGPLRCESEFYTADMVSLGCHDAQACYLTTAGGDVTPAGIGGVTQFRTVRITPVKVTATTFYLDMVFEGTTPYVGSYERELVNGTISSWSFTEGVITNPGTVTQVYRACTTDGACTQQFQITTGIFDVDELIGTFDLTFDVLWNNQALEADQVTRGIQVDVVLDTNSADDAVTANIGTIPTTFKYGSASGDVFDPNHPVLPGQLVFVDAGFSSVDFTATVKHVDLRRISATDSTPIYDPHTNNWGIKNDVGTIRIFEDGAVVEAGYSPLAVAANGDDIEDFQFNLDPQYDTPGPFWVQTIWEVSLKPSARRAMLGLYQDMEDQFVDITKVILEGPPDADKINDDITNLFSWTSVYKNDAKDGIQILGVGLVTLSITVLAAALVAAVVGGGVFLVMSAINVPKIGFLNSWIGKASPEFAEAIDVPRRLGYAGSRYSGVATS